MTDRDRVLRPLLARAKKAGRSVYGYFSGKAGCARMSPKDGVPDEWDRICVEGDTGWAVLPPVEEQVEYGTGRKSA